MTRIFGLLIAAIIPLNMAFALRDPLIIGLGGTGQTTAPLAINALLPAQAGHSGECLMTNATVAAWQACTGGGGSSYGIAGALQLSDGSGGFTSEATYLFWNTLTKTLKTADTTTTDSNDLTIATGATTSGDPGLLTLRGGDTDTHNGAGGVSIRGGASTGAAASGGGVSMTGGDSAFSQGGYAVISGGWGLPFGGNIQLYSGDALDVGGHGGALGLYAGSAYDASGVGGSITIWPGDGGAGGSTGKLYLQNVNEGTSGDCLVSYGTSGEAHWDNCPGGGSGATYTADQYGVMLSDATNATMSVLSPSASTALPLVSGGASANPSWSVLTVPGGGTGLTTLTAHSLQVGNGAGTVTQIAVGATGEMLQGASVSDPQWTHMPIIGGVPGDGKLQISSSLGGTVGVTVDSSTGSYNYILPIAAGSAGNVLTSQAGGSTPMTWTVATDANTNSAIVKRDGSGNFSAGTITAALTGLASTATLATNATNTAITDDTATNATMYPTWVTTTTGNLPQKISSTKLSFNPSTGMLTSTGFTGPLTGTASGNADKTLSNLTAPTDIPVNLLPHTYPLDLGDATHYWRQLYLEYLLDSSGVARVDISSASTDINGGTGGGGDVGIYPGIGDKFIMADGSEGTSGECLVSYGTDGEGHWDTCPGGSGVTTMAAVGAVPNADGASISGVTLTLQPADLTHPGVVAAGAQTFAGPLTVASFIGALTGNADTATSATTATNAVNVGITNDTTTNATMYPLWATANTGNLPVKVSSTKLSFNPSTGTLTSTAFSGPLTGAVTGNADTATAATNTAITDDTATNATMYPTWVTTTTGNLPQKVSSTKLTFNPSTANLTTTTFTGALAGNATTATSSTTATNATNVGITDDTTTNATMYPAWFTAATGNLPTKVSSTKLTFNPSTANLTTTTFTGALAGNATTATSATSATSATTATNSTNVGVTDDITTNAEMYPTWVTAATGNLPAKVSSTKLSFHPSTATLSIGAVTGSAVITGTSNAAGAPGDGTSLEVKGGASAAGGTNSVGGSLTFTAAVGTGNGASTIAFQVPQLQASGTTSQAAYQPALTITPISVGVAEVKIDDYLRIGRATGSTGSLLLYGTTSGAVTIQPQDAAGTYNFNLPTTAGTSGYLLTSAGGVGSPMTWTDPSTLGGGVTTVGAFGSSPDVKGASISGVTITMQPADATHPGLVKAGAQTFAGPLTVASFVGALTGNADTATLATTATNATNTAITNDTTTNADMFPTWVTANTGNLPQKVSSTKLIFHPSTGILTATGFSGPLTGAVTGNADTATALADNPADCASDTYATSINASGTLGCGTVTNAGLAGSIAASKLVGSDIATVGTITTGVWSGTIVTIAKGGTGVTLAATGGASQVLKQVSTGANVTVGTLSCADLSDDAASCATDATNMGNAASGTLVVGRGGTGVTAVPTSATASVFAAWDSNANMLADNFVAGFRSIATAATTTTFVVGDVFQTAFTGITTQTAKMPVVSTMVNGQQFEIVNLSSGIVTVQTSGLNTIQAMGTNTILRATVLDATAGTGTASWTWTYGPLIAAALTNPMTTTGDIIYSSDNSGTPAKLGIGATNKVLTVIAGVPSWQTAASGGLTTTSVTGSVTATANSFHITNCTAACTITMPSPVAGNIIYIKDKSGNANLNNITVARAGSEQIEFVAASFIITANYGLYCFITDGTDWFRCN